MNLIFINYENNEFNIVIFIMFKNLKNMFNKKNESIGLGI